MGASRVWRQSVRLGVLVAGAALLGCADASVPAGLGTSRLAASEDTVPGTGSLTELQERRAAWLERGLEDYDVELQISCFCTVDITRPALVEVRKGAVSRVLDLRTATPRGNGGVYPTITMLFDRAIAERSGGGPVSVAYDTELGIPVRLEIGTLANDAGTLYLLGHLQPR